MTKKPIIINIQDILNKEPSGLQFLEEAKKEIEKKMQSPYVKRYIDPICKEDFIIIKGEKRRK